MRRGARRQGRSITGAAGAAWLLALAPLPPACRSVDVDVLVYGATPAGVLAAAAAAGEGASVALLDPRAHFGGAVAGGLCETDTGTTTAVLGGRTRAFFAAMGAAYGLPAGTPAYAFEPRVAQAELRRMLAAAGPGATTLALSTRLVAGARGPGGRLASATDASGATHTARVWVDASYEGWLLPLAGIAHTWGREAASVYGESVAGVIASPYAPTPNYTVQGDLFAAVDARWPNGSCCIE